MQADFRADLEAIRNVEAVPLILNVVCRVTGMGFAAVARVTEGRWVCLAVNDEINFGLAPGGELKVETTICREVRECHGAGRNRSRREDEIYRDHPTPAMYGFQSYISMPIILKEGGFFGTLCAIDPRPARLKNPGDHRDVSPVRRIDRDASRCQQASSVERSRPFLGARVVAVARAIHRGAGPRPAQSAGVDCCWHAATAEGRARSESRA